jgi:hypothetical protein
LKVESNLCTLYKGTRLASTAAATAVGGWPHKTGGRECCCGRNTASTTCANVEVVNWLDTSDIFQSFTKIFSSSLVAHVSGEKIHYLTMYRIFMSRILTKNVQFVPVTLGAKYLKTEHFLGKMKKMDVYLLSMLL